MLQWGAVPWCDDCDRFLSPSTVRTTIPGRLPNLKMWALFGLSAAALPAPALAVAGSPLAGGIRNCDTGYAIARDGRASRNESGRTSTAP